MTQPAEKGLRVRRTQRMTIKPREAAALHRLLDAYLATDYDDPGYDDLVAFCSRLRHAQMDHALYATPAEPSPDREGSDQ